MMLREEEIDRLFYLFIEIVSLQEGWDIGPVGAAARSHPATPPPRPLAPPLRVVSLPPGQ